MSTKYSYNAEVLLNDGFVPLYKKLIHKHFTNGTVEIIDAHLRFHGGYEMALDLGTHRKPQLKYIENEKNWYLSMDRCIKGHPGIEDNKIWRDVCATDIGMVNSNYGWCVFSPENGYEDKTPCFCAGKCTCRNESKSQYDYALEQLKKNEYSRQSVIFYNRPQMQFEYNDNIHAKSDFTCTINTQHFIRNDIFNYIVYMRSNDIIRGLHCGDAPWHGYIFNKMYDELKQTYPDLQKGDIFWNAGSLHCYERDYDLLTKITEEFLGEETVKQWKKDANITE